MHSVRVICKIYTLLLKLLLKLKLKHAHIENNTHNRKEITVFHTTSGDVIPRNGLHLLLISDQYYIH